MYSTTGNPTSRLLNCLGGYLERHYDYSANMILGSMPYMYGDQFSPYDNVHCSSFSEAANNSDLVVMFGNSPAETRMGGANAAHGISPAFARAFSEPRRQDCHLSTTRHERDGLRGIPTSGCPFALVPTRHSARPSAHEWIVDRQSGQGIPRCLLPRLRRGHHARFRQGSEQVLQGLHYGHRLRTWWRRRPEWAAPITQIPASQHPRTCRTTMAAAKAPIHSPRAGPPAPHQWRGHHAALFALLPVLLGKMGPSGHQLRASAKAWRSA